MAALLSAEEARFSQHARDRPALLDERARPLGRPASPAEDAFKLHDTYGFPFELTAEIAAEHGKAVDEAGLRRG